MPSSQNHHYYTHCIVSWIENNYSKNKMVVIADLDNPIGEERPPNINGYIPDVYARNIKNDITIIGEAKTQNDISNEHTKNQIRSYLDYLCLARQGILVIATQWDSVNSIKSIVKLALRDSSSDSLQTIFLSVAGERIIKVTSLSECRKSK